MGMERATGVKVFSTTLARDRDGLGDVITRWLAEHPGVEIVDKVVRQSSDRQFHCLSVTLFYREGK
jgi:folate-dependent tRNA-U54 methylase TrmFO/GidA